MKDLVFRNHTKSRAFGRAFFVRILKSAAKEIPVSGARTSTLSINLVTPAKIRSLNRQYRGKDAPTDVLSFPLADKEIPAYNEARDLGDIFICPAEVKKKAKESGRSVGQYMSWAAVHGLLHLLGYDHEKSSSAAKKMLSLEGRILKKL